MASSATHDASLSRYIARVRGIPTLSREAEHDLAVRALTGDRAAAHRLVEANLRYVVAVALQYRRYGIRVGDLVAEGNLGLMMAVSKFDPERGTRFVTYAGYWIRAYMLDLVVRSSTMVGVGSGPLRSKIFFRLRRERAKVANLVDDPDERDEILAAKFNVTKERMQDMTRRLDARDVSLDAQVYGDSSATLMDTLAGDLPGQDAQFQEAEREHSVHQLLSGALDGLDRRERYIVERRIMSDDEMSLADLGRELGVSRERARQLEARAKKKLQRQLSAARPDVAELAVAAGWA
jgi:RNA polymerase sigma-32 factor